MRRIKSEADIQRVRRRNNVILGVVMIGLLILSYAGFALMNSDENGENQNFVEEKGFNFVRDGGYWKMMVDGQVFGFQNLPSEVDDVDVNISVEFANYVSLPLYFVGAGEGANEILINLGNYVLRYQEACLEGMVCDGDLPTKSCEDSNLIIFEAGDEARVYSEGTCVFVVGDELEASDAFLYKLFGIN